MFLAPPVCTQIFKAARIVGPASSPAWKTSIDLLSISMGLLIAAPFGFAIFPQEATIPIDQLEDDLRIKSLEKGYSHLTFNKGL